jgi:hypothetical protein
VTYVPNRSLGTVVTVGTLPQKVEIEKLDVELKIAPFVDQLADIFIVFSAFSAPCALNRVEMELSAPSSPSTGPLMDIDDVDIDTELSRASTPVSTSLSLPLRRQTPRPSSLGPDFIGYCFKHGGFSYTIQERSAVKKGGKSSYI